MTGWSARLTPPAGRTGAWIGLKFCRDLSEASEITSAQCKPRDWVRNCGERNLFASRASPFSTHAASVNGMLHNNDQDYFFRISGAVKLPPDVVLRARKLIKARAFFSFVGHEL